MNPGPIRNMATALAVVLICGFAGPFADHRTLAYQLTEFSQTNPAVYGNSLFFIGAVFVLLLAIGLNSHSANKQ